MFTLSFSKKFVKQFVKLDKNVRVLITKKLKLLKNGYKDNPNVKKLVSHKFEYRLRVGDYRILFNVEKNRIILLGCIRHRKEAY